jgi:hypothetical protein
MRHLGMREILTDVQIGSGQFKKLLDELGPVHFSKTKIQFSVKSSEFGESVLSFFQEERLEPVGSIYDTWGDGSRREV